MRKPDLSCAFEAISIKIGNRPGAVISTPEHQRCGWKIDVSSMKDGACLSRWLLHCPHVHMAWDHYLVGLVHLRSEEGLAPPVLTKPDSEYELGLLIIDPASTPNPDNPFSIRVLQGAAVSTQFGGGLTDEQAIAITESCVLACVGGRLMPDEDGRDQWEKFVAHEARLARVRN